MLLAACGGGSSGGSPSSIDNPPPTNSSSSSISLAKTVLQMSETTVVTAKFTDVNGVPVVGGAVQFSTLLGSLNPANGQATTDATGAATIQLVAGNTTGDDVVSASATIAGRQVTKSVSYKVTLPPLTLSPITLGLATIPYGGSTSVSVSIRDASGNLYTAQDVDVYFTSVQASAGKSTIPAKVSSVNGVATVTYQAGTNVGSDIIYATLGESSTVQANLSVTPLSAGSITYVSAVPTSLALKGTGGINKSEVAVVTFKVLDSSGAPRPNTTVDFSLNTTIGGIALSSSSGSTGADGTVVVQVTSGIIATPVRVMATVRGTTISTQSEQLVISTGLPAQDGFSISIANLSPESWSIDGVTTTVTARLSDHFHNPAPDGTAVYFTTSGGSIQPSCTTVGGACSVTWTSQNPRPYAPQSSKSGRAVILAYAVGEEAFIDLNGNGLADAGEFTDTTGAFRDDNENGSRDANETFVPFNQMGVFDPKDGKFNGILQGASSLGAPTSKHVFSNNVLVMASSAALITNSCGNSVAVAQGASTACTITVNDVNGNTMPSGTKVAFSFDSVVTGIKLTSSDYTFPNTAASTGASLGIVLTDGTVAPAAVGRGVFTVKVTSPGGVETTRAYSVN
jgi:hypothetical protein